VELLRKPGIRKGDVKKERKKKEKKILLQAWSPDPFAV